MTVGELMDCLDQVARYVDVKVEILDIDGLSTVPIKDVVELTEQTLVSNTETQNTVIIKLYGKALET